MVSGPCLLSPVVHLAPRAWSTLQIVTPFIAAILSIIITLFSVSIYRRHNLRGVKWRDEFVHRLRPPQKVKSVHELGSEWQIEPQELESHEEGVTKLVDEPFVFVDESTPGGPDTIPGHPSRYSQSSGGIRDSSAAGGPGTVGGSDTIPGNPSRYSESSGGTRERPAVDRPGVGRGYPFGPTHQIQARTHLIPVRYLPGKNGSSTDSELDTNRRWRFPGSSSFKGIQLPRPWKRVPEKLVEVQPTKRFRVDPRTSGSGCSQSMEGTETTRDSATTYPRRSFDIADHLEGESDSPDYRDYVQEGGVDAGSDNEDTNLISPEEREERRRVGVVKTRSLARSSGTGTSTNPNINVVSPTVSSSSPLSTRVRGPSPLKANVCPSFILLAYTHFVQFCLQAAVPPVPPIIPPPPTQPAPSVPANIFKRVLPRRRENIVEAPIDQQPLVVPDRVTMTPIQEDRSEEGKSSVRSSPSPIPARSNLNDQQGTSGPVPGPSRIVAKRTPSDDPPKPSPSPAPSISGQALPYYLRAHQRAPSPSPSLHENTANGSPNLKPQTSATSLSRLLPFEPLSPPTYSHQRTASASASVVSVTRTHDDIYGDPVLPRAQIRRGLSADDAASVNLMLDPLSAVPPRNGSPRPQVGREDAGALFPVSVRGAGYRGIPNS